MARANLAAKCSLVASGTVPPVKRPTAVITALNALLVAARAQHVLTLSFNLLLLVVFVNAQLVSNRLALFASIQAPLVAQIAMFATQLELALSALQVG